MNPHQLYWQLNATALISSIYQLVFWAKLPISYQHFPYPSWWNTWIRWKWFHCLSWFIYGRTNICAGSVCHPWGHLHRWINYVCTSIKYWGSSFLDFASETLACRLYYMFGSVLTATLLLLLTLIYSIFAYSNYYFIYLQYMFLNP